MSVLRTSCHCRPDRKASSSGASSSRFSNALTTVAVGSSTIRCARSIPPLAG
jgi:hypothetical protein